jgi:putative heme iron utilization protein
MEQIIEHICNRKQGNYSDHRMCKMVTLNETCDNPTTSTFLSVVGRALKSAYTQNKLLRIESTGRYTHHKPMKVVYILQHRKGKLTIAKLNSLRLSYNVVVSLPFESILSKMFRYEGDKSDSVV